jgi:hypothetical protein
MATIQSDCQRQGECAHTCRLMGSLVLGEMGPRVYGDALRS